LYEAGELPSRQLMDNGSLMMMKRRTLIVTWFPKTLLTTRPTVSQMMLNLKKKSVTPAQMTSQTMTMMVRATTVRNVCLRTVKLLGVRLRILTHTEDDLKVILLEKKRGLAASIGDLSSPVEALNCFLDEDFYSRVTNHTNQELVRVIAKMTYEDKHNYRYREFSVDETRAAVGLLLLAGVTSARRESLEQLWDEKRGRSIFRATMSCTRFKVFLLAARFDDKTSRHTRRETDKLAPIRELFDSFVSKCKQLYTMSPFVCVDECLLGFRGRCSFRVYMPSKPAKYGLKVWMLCDVGTSFAGNLQVYLGKESTGLPEKGQGARVVKDLCGYIFNSTLLEKYPFIYGKSSGSVFAGTILADPYIYGTCCSVKIRNKISVNERISQKCSGKNAAGTKIPVP
jgi:hypothetical protein